MDLGPPENPTLGAHTPGWAPDPDDPTPGMHLPGWIRSIEVRWLARQATRMRSIVEIGSFRGRSSYALGSSCSGPVYCIDPWNDEIWPAWWDGVGSVLPNVVPIRGSSPDAGAQVPGDIDMVFIDGAHDYESVRADILHWLPRTQVLLCGHDYGVFPGVQEAVDEVFADEAMVVHGTWIWAVALDGQPLDGPEWPVDPALSLTTD